MKTWIIAITSVAAGLAVGAGSSLVELSGTSARFRPGAAEERSAGSSEDVPAGIAGRHARLAVVNGATFDFGVMSRDATLEHTYVIKNVGAAPLTLRIQGTTCKCTVGELTRNEVPVGETAELTLQWTAKSYETTYHQSATVETNDPRQPRLTLSIEGRVEQIVRPAPTEITFGRVAVNDTRQAQLRLFGYREDTFEIVEHRFSNAEYAELFDVQMEPLPEVEVAAEQGAKCGFVVTVTIRPGLPLGRIRQQLHLTTNLADVQPLQIPINGTIVSDVSVVGGRKFDRENMLLKIGPVGRDAGTKEKLHIVVKGPHRKDVDLNVVMIDPPGILRAEIGQVKSLNQGAALMYPLIIQIVPGSPAVNRLGSQQGQLGRVKIDTNHPQAKIVQLYVQFAVE